MRIPTSRTIKPRTNTVNLDAADDARLLGLGEAMPAVGGLGHTLVVLSTNEWPNWTTGRTEPREGTVRTIPPPPPLPPAACR